MKKLMITLICIASFGITAVNAQTEEKVNAPTAEKVNEGFVKIKATSLPSNIKGDLKKNYSKDKLESAYVNKKMEYKLVFKTEEADTFKVVYANTKRGILNN